MKLLIIFPAALVLAGPLSAAPQSITLAAATEFAATVSLLKFDGKQGRSTPFFNGYRPGLRFAGSAAEVTCSVSIQGPQDSVSPGESAQVQLRCLDKVVVMKDKPEFVFYEGGRKVGSGVLALPAAAQ